MKKRFLYIALIALTLGACTEQDIVEQPSIPTDGGGDGSPASRRCQLG